MCGYRDWRALVVDLKSGGIRLWSWTGKLMSQIRGRFSVRGSPVAKALPPCGKNERLQDEIDSLRSEVASLYKRIQQLEEFAKNTRWLELESRRVAYVQLCRELAPYISVVDSHEPKILVTLKNVVRGITDDVDGEYFGLVGC